MRAMVVAFVGLMLCFAGCATDTGNPVTDSDISNEKEISDITDEEIKDDQVTTETDDMVTDTFPPDESTDEIVNLPDEDTLIPFEAIILADPATVTENGTATFTAQISGGTPPYTFAWTFDGAAPDSQQEQPEPVLFPDAGDFTISLTVTDAEEKTAGDTLLLTVQPLEGQMHFYYGNLHSHSGISDGEGTPTEIMNWAKFDEQLDFYVMTDHAEQIFGNEWEEVKTQTDLFNEPGVFAAMRGFEWSHPWNGHICIYLTDDFTSAYNELWISYIYDWIDERPALAQFNHPGREDGVFNDLKLESKVVDNMFAMETGNKSTGNNDGEFISYYIQALDNGWQIAPTSNQDNHSMSLTSHRSVFVAEELSRETLVEAMSARRFYSSDDPDIRVVFKHEDLWMGSHVTDAVDPVRFAVKVEDNEPIVKLQLISHSGTVVAETTPEESGTTLMRWFPEVTVPQSAYFFLKVISEDLLDDDGPEQVVVTAPIWIYR